MEHRPFGRTGLTVPVIGMGTWQSLDVRGERDERARMDIVDDAIRAGTTLFDTSPMYGESERVLGRALVPHRAKVLVADKVWTQSARDGREQVRKALEWYGGTVDIYQVHNLVAWREHLPFLHELKEEGKIKVVGATHYAHSSFPELLRVMRSGQVGMIQVPYNAADREVEREVLPLAHELGLGVLVMEPLGSGSLIKRSPPASEIARLAPYGIRTWAQALLRWILNDPRAHCVIPATRSRDRAVENAAAGSAKALSPADRARIAEFASMGS